MQEEKLYRIYVTDCIGGFTKSKVRYYDWINPDKSENEQLDDQDEFLKNLNKRAGLTMVGGEEY